VGQKAIQGKSYDVVALSNVSDYIRQPIKFPYLSIAMDIIAEQNEVTKKMTEIRRLINYTNRAKAVEESYEKKGVYNGSIQNYA